MQKKFWSLAVFLIFTIVSFCQDIDVKHYKFQLELSDSSDKISGVAEITLQFLKRVSAFQLDFNIGGSNAKGMHPQIVQNNKIAGVDYKENSIDIKLSKPASLDSTYKFIVVYSGQPADGLIISKNKYGDRTFFADNWPNRAHYWIPCNDRPDDKASFEFVVTAPSQYSIISNGIKIEERKFSNGFTLTHWKEDIPLPTKVMVIGAAKFAVKEFADSPPNIPVSAWVYQKDSAKGFHDYAVAPEILKFFSSYIGPYPYNKLANVQSKTIFGGMENASAIFYAENTVTGKGGVEDLLAHEIAHQWFGDMASEKSFAHLWLSEGFASYLTSFYLEKKYGKQMLSKRMEDDRKQVIQFVKNNDKPVVDSVSPLMDLLNANSYQKGAWALHMLRDEVGDSVFHKIIQTYYQQYKGKNADTRDFEAVAEKVSGKNLRLFFDQWLYRPGIPQLIIERNIDKDEVKIRITQQGRKFEFPLEVAIVRTDGSSIKQTIDVNDQMVEFKIKVPDVKDVVIDPDTKLLYSEIKK